MKGLRTLAVIAAVAASSLSGCIYTKIHAVGLQSSAQSRPAPSYETLGEAEGMSSSFTFLWALPLTPRITLDEAYNEAIRSKGGDNLIGMSIWREKQVWILGTIDTIRVKGTVIRTLHKD